MTPPPLTQTRLYPCSPSRELWHNCLVPEFLELPFPSSRALVFADFNCPYCFVLNEWIERISAGNRVRWVGVEHKPELRSAGSNTASQIKLLERELDDVRARAPEVEIGRPALWANSRDALLLQNAIEVEAPMLAPVLRTRIYALFWRQGGHSVDASALRSLRRELQLPEPYLDPEELDRYTLWWREHLDRVPVMLAPTGVAHFGLQNLANVERFVDSALRGGELGPGCQ